MCLMDFESVGWFVLSVWMLYVFERVMMRMNAFVKRTVYA